MNNFVLGKTMENLTNRTDVRLVSNKKNYLKWTSKPNFKLQKIFDNDLAKIRKSRVTWKLNNPLYVGMRILDLSKALV